MASLTKSFSPLSQEMETFRGRQSELLRTAKGKFVVIKGTQIFGIFDNEAEAYRQAIRQFGLTPFLMREIQEGEKIYYVGGSALEQHEG